MKPRDECGVVGLWGVPEAAKRAYLALYALQHRGQESAGIATLDKRITRHAGQGLVQEVFKKKDLYRLHGSAAIGHVRYSTSGYPNLEGAQPILAETTYGQVAIAHNGNLVNASEVRQRQQQAGAVFRTTVDTEVLLHSLVSTGAATLQEALPKSLGDVRGAYSMVLLTESGLFAVRDPNGFRPLVLGKLAGGWVVASESCAFDLLDAEYVREVAPGEVLHISDAHPEPVTLANKAAETTSLCVFELIYFSRPDSRVFGHSVYEARVKLGSRLAEVCPAAADIVIPVPDSSNAAALGYADVLGIPFRHGLVRSHYVGRTFIEPSETIRDFGAKLKYNPVKEVVLGKRVVVVDDSVVRGRTCKKITRMLLQAGATEVHFRVSCPPWRFPCNYGIDTPTATELLGHGKTLKEIGEAIGADSIGYLPLKDMLDTLSGDYCTACFTGNYPVRFGLREAKGPLENGAYG